MTEPLIVRNGDSYDLDTREQLQVELETYRKYAEQGECEKPQSEENGDTRERLEAWAHEEIAEKWAQSDREVMMIMDDLLYMLDRQAAITRRDCAKCAEGMGAYADSLCDPLKERIAELTAERDRLLAKVDELNANWRKANDGWAEANAEVERLEHANNTLRASVAGLKLTVDRLNARDGAEQDKPGGGE